MKLEMKILNQIILLFFISICSSYVYGQFNGGVGRGDIMIEMSSQSLGESCNPTFSELNVSTCNAYSLNNETFTESGTYSQTVQNSFGCDSIITINLSLTTDTLNILVTPSNDVNICEGDSVLLVAETGFNNYTWNNGLAGAEVYILSSGVYKVSGTDSLGCYAVSDEIIVNTIDIPIPSFTYEQTDGYTVEFTNNTIDGTSFLWDFGGGNTSSQTNPSFIYPFDGFYNVTLTVSNQCGSDTISTTIEVLKLSINSLNENLIRFNIYPNPSNGIVTISGEVNIPDRYNLTLVNILGQVIFNETIFISKDWSKQIDLNEFSEGIYWFTISNEINLISKKIILTNGKI